jgi:starvation-inducible DNA-binding protein
MKRNFGKERSAIDRARPLVDQHSVEIQPFGTIAKLPIALAEDVCKSSVENLNQLLADTMWLRNLSRPCNRT